MTRTAPGVPFDAQSGNPIDEKPLIFLVQRASTAGLGDLENLFIFQ